MIEKNQITREFIRSDRESEGPTNHRLRVDRVS